MLPYVLLGLAVTVGYHFFHTYLCFNRNLTAAKKSGIPYVVAPFYAFSRFWLISHRLFLPYFKKLPASWTAQWIDYATPDWAWDELYRPYAKLGTDSFLIVSPGKIVLCVADASVINQITTRRNDFPKPVEIYRAVNIYGRNVVSTEGSQWRQHRKVTSPPFTEKNNHLVWHESIHQANSMVHEWLARTRSDSPTIEHVGTDTMRLSLHIISRAGFGVRLLWPHEEEEKRSKGEETRLPPGHEMAYKDALEHLLENLVWVMLLPRWLLVRLPFAKAKLAYAAFVEWGQYMNELYQSKQADIRNGKIDDGMDLMGALIQGSGLTDSDPKSSSQKNSLMSYDEILGNSFVFILAGHETTANTIHYSMLYLALNPAAQRHLQQDLDKQLGIKPIVEWDYEHDLPKLFSGMTAAVMNEELRLLPPVISIPKSCTATTDQTLTMNGRKVIVPAGTYINVQTVAAHRNPKYWPTSHRAASESVEDDLNAFKPERWLQKTDSSTAPQSNGGPTDEEYGGSSGEDVSSALFHPEKGAYLPFSEGARSCLGRRFAQIEVLAVLAVLFKEWSVELAVDEFATQAEVDAMPVGGAERAKVWSKAADRAHHLLRHGMMTLITIQMRNGHVPLRLVRRGKERFMFDA